MIDRRQNELCHFKVLYEIIRIEMLSYFGMSTFTVCSDWRQGAE